MESAERPERKGKMEKNQAAKEKRKMKVSKLNDAICLLRKLSVPFVKEDLDVVLERKDGVFYIYENV